MQKNYLGILLIIFCDLVYSINLMTFDLTIVNNLDERVAFAFIHPDWLAWDANLSLIYMKPRSTLKAPRISIFLKVEHFDKDRPKSLFDVQFAINNDLKRILWSRLSAKGILSDGI